MSSTQRKKRQHGLWLLPLFLVFVSACSLFFKKKEKEHFQHFRHHTLSCKKCHKPNAAGKMSLTPPVSTCIFCHQDKKDRPKMVATIRKYRTYQSMDRHIIFSHKTHQSRWKGRTRKQQCAHCHGDVTSRNGGRRVPTMARCLSCHVHKKQYDTMRCKVCHTNLRRFPIKPLSDYRHTADFVRTHKRYAKGKLDLCVQCHDQPYCAKCHDPKLPMKPSLRFPEQTIQGMIHRGDFTTRHGRIARLKPTLCKSCHGPSGCVSCHQQNANVLAKRGKRSPHPVGYVRRGGSAFHGRDARRDPSRCQSCHDQGARSNCVTCHRVGGFGGNPHPPSWRISNRLNPQKNGMCRYCHNSTSR